MIYVTATIDSLKLMNLKQLTVATSYLDWLNVAQQKIVEDSGLRYFASKA